MSTREFRELLAPQKVRAPLTPAFGLTQVIKDSVKLRTLMVLGALGQAMLLQLLPKRLAILPAAVLALHSIVTTVVQVISGKHDYNKDVIPGRSTSQLPNRESGTHGSEAAAEPVVVFHFGVRFSHPMGLLSPGGKEIGEFFVKCLGEVQRDAESYGLLGMTNWRGNDAETINTILMVFYFRDLEGLHRFAQGRIHRDAWDWTVRAGHKHIGFFHETFSVPRKAYENIYVNMPPTSFGQARVKCQRPEEGGEQMVSTLVSADARPLRTMVNRLGYKSEKDLVGI